MKYLLIAYFSFISLHCFSQPDTSRTLEPDFKTSFQNYSPLIAAVLGLLLLIGLWFWFRRVKKNKG